MIQWGQSPSLLPWHWYTTLSASDGMPLQILMSLRRRNLVLGVTMNGCEHVYSPRERCLAMGPRLECRCEKVLTVVL